MNRIRFVFLRCFLIFVVSELQAAEETFNPNAEEFADEVVFNGPRIDNILSMALNTTQHKMANDQIAKAISDRFKFLDLSYVKPDSDGSTSGWNAKYNWMYQRGSGEGFSVSSQRATLKEVNLNIELSGSYSYGDADNIEEYSRSRLGFSYLRGDFGKINYIEKDKSIAFQTCLAEAAEGDDAAEDLCFSSYRIDRLVNDGQSSYVYSVDIHASIEGDQRYSNKQTAFGLGGMYSREKFPSVRLDFERIDASDDRVRAAFTEENKFDRVSAEIGYKYNILNVGGYSTWLYISYRYFKEMSPPDAIVDAKMDEFDYVAASIRVPAKLLGFVDTDEFNLYIRYVDGQLPFDRQSDKAIQLGFSTNMAWLGKLIAQ